jgi:hypothetical protein
MIQVINRLEDVKSKLRSENKVILLNQAATIQSTPDMY